MHLQPGSVRVKTGERVRRGQLLGLVGASGDAREPHLHFEVTTSAGVMTGEGVPFVIDSYRVMEGGMVGPQTPALPLNNGVVDFGIRHTD
jgi:murein DD-endopeptidase MepM/ murein hydrolase activator NlpD